MFWARDDLQDRKISFVLFVCVCAQSHLTLQSDGYSPLCSSVLGILQARILLEWVAVPYSWGSSWPRNQTCVSCIVRQILYHWAAWEDLCLPWLIEHIDISALFGDVQYKDEDNYFLRIVCLMVSMPGYYGDRSWDFNQHWLQCCNHSLFLLVTGDFGRWLGNLLLLFSREAVFNSQPHGLQHTRLPCPSPSPRVCSDWHPLNRWCHPIISSSVIPFSSCLQSFPASGCFLMS